MSFSSLILLFASQAITALAQISTVNGQALYSATPVLQNPLGVPTLVYNCAKVPALCKNVNGNGGAYSLSTLPGGLNGGLANGNYLTLHVDPDADRGDDRRTESCPGNWKKNHVCPEPDQPLVVPAPFNKGGRTVSTGGFVGYAMDGSVSNYRILDPSGAQTGMAWTCDEFPPAFSIQGGQTGGSTANTYCAPQFAKICDPGNPDDEQYTRSEQDFQSSAHGRIQSKEVAAGSGTQLVYTSNIWEFHFKTVFDDDDNSYATRVDWYIDSNGVSGSLYGIDEIEQKRSEQKILVSHRAHGNGSSMELRRFVDMDHGMPDGTHPIHDPFHFEDVSDVTKYLAKPLELPGVKVATRYLREPTPTLRPGEEKRDACVTDITQITDQPDAAAPAPVQSTFATYSCDVASVATSVGYN
ncbi:hypothetical protein LTR78_004508 [Recurvomyces mirabilis]|uniref:Uncharacterized protein n=1 Tax=Recurvomyces mirabilis TaxID=574656 RepID=A0AAE0WPI4_9PEZI|nr:hypothetical protein LTR78_004508 [Recurvomyces mirabilis]KAK5152999.1 hypothetical protein LTS14_008107 [Recurvomyces mirabilis]